MRLRDRIKLAIIARRIANGLPDIETMKEKLKSRKLWAAVLGAALATFGGQLGVSAELINTAVQLVMVYIGGQAIVDAASAATNPVKK